MVSFFKNNIEVNEKVTKVDNPIHANEKKRLSQILIGIEYIQKAITNVTIIGKNNFLPNNVKRSDAINFLLIK